MAVELLLNFLQENNLNFGIFKDGIWIKNQHLNTFQLNDTHLWILTNDNHEIELDLSDLFEIDFDAIVSIAINSSDMESCLSKLEEYKPYNVYFRNSNNEIFFRFIKIN